MGKIKTTGVIISRRRRKSDCSMTHWRWREPRRWRRQGKNSQSEFFSNVLRRRQKTTLATNIKRIRRRHSRPFFLRTNERKPCLPTTDNELYTWLNRRTEEKRTPTRNEPSSSVFFHSTISRVIKHFFMKFLLKNGERDSSRLQWGHFVFYHDLFDERD